MKLLTGDLFKHISSDDCYTLTHEEHRNLQHTLTLILNDIVDVCKRHSINYCLAGGTLLGAFRHNGFIPWDDDIDLLMPREDFEKFVKIFKEEMVEKYWVHTPETTDNYALLFGRVLLKGTSYKTRDDFNNDECGVFIDIFIVENTPDSKFFRTLHGFVSLGLGFGLSCRKFFRDRKYLMSLCKNNDKLVRAIRIKSILGFFAAILSVNCWTRLADKWHGLCKNKNSKYVTVPSGRNRYFKEIYLREDVAKYTDVVFEGLTVNSPRNMDAYLSALYGDYKKVPEAHERETHSVLKPFSLGEFDTIKGLKQSS